MKQKRVSSILRMLVGVYLVYLAYDLLDQFHFEKLQEDLFSFGFGFLYLIIGISLMIWGGVVYYKASKEEESE